MLETANHLEGLPSSCSPIRRKLLQSVAAAGLAGPAAAAAREPGSSHDKVTIAVGGKNLFYYLPLTIAEQLGLFRKEGLQVEIVDFAGGARALQSVLDGSADVVSGAYEHTINMQARGQMMRAFVLQGRAPQVVLGVSTRTMPAYRQVSDLKGKRIGVTAPRSSTSMVVSFVLSRAGLKPSEVNLVGVGASTAAVAAVKSGQVDAIANLDPVIAILQRDKAIRVIADLRTLTDTQQIFGGPMPAGCLYAPEAFMTRRPDTVQALTQAMVKALRWLQDAGPSDLVRTVPEAYLLGDRALYLDAWLRVREAMSPDGLFPDQGARTALRALQAFDSTLSGKRIDLARTFTNQHTRQALARMKA